MASRPVEYSNGGLTKRHTTGGWRWAAQVKWRYVGEKKWRTKLRALVDDEGAPIMTDPRKMEPDPKTGKKKDTNTRGINKARKAYSAWMRELGNMSYDNKLDVREYLVGYIDTLWKQREAAIKRDDGKKPPYSASTLRGYSEYVPIVADGFGGKPMAEVTSTDVYKWVESMKDRGLAASTMRKAFSLFSKCCDHAARKGDMPRNPCDREIRSGIERVSMEEPNFLTPEQIVRVNQLLDSADNPRLRIGARIALHCGLRAGEICGLRWRDVDLDAAEIHVQEAIVNRGGGTDKASPKSFAGIRTVPMTPALAYELAAWRHVQEREWVKMWTRTDAPTQPDAIPFEDCRVIGYANGNWFTPHSMGHLWGLLARGRHDRDPNDRRKTGTGWIEGREPIIGATGKRVRLHDCRHTYATYHVALGTNIATVAQLMGHADSAVTLRRYSGRVRDLQPLDGMTIADVLSNGCGTGLTQNLSQIES